MFRERVAELIQKELGMTICGEADSVDAAMELIATAQPDIAIVDLNLRQSSGLELLRLLKKQESKLPVLVLSMHDEDSYATRVLRAGARGYISKERASSEIIQAIPKVLAGEIYVSDEVKAKLLQQVGKTSDRVGMDLFSDREWEVFRLVGRGLNSREIAKELSLSEVTVTTYRHRIKQKLDYRNAADLYRKAALWVAEQEGLGGV